MKIIIFLIALLTAAPVWAVTVTIGDNTGDTFSGTDDTKLRQADATTNFGTLANSEITKYTPTDHTYTAIKFTGLSSITGPVTVTSATIFLWLEDSSHGESISFSARRLLRNWVEAQATWNLYSTGNSWSTAGGINALDRETTASATGSVTTAGAYYAFTGAGLITDVQNIIDGTASNFGWHIERTDAGGNSRYNVITTSEGTNGRRPYLSVTYTEGAEPEPEPPPGGGAGGTRLGLHVTQEELNVWRARMTDNVNTINQKTFQSVYQNRILADANSFRSQSHPGGDGFWAGYTGTGCAPDGQNPGGGGTPFGRGNGAYMMRSAFNFLLTGDNTYANPVRTELLNQIAQAGTNWANTSKWCTFPSLQGTVNTIEVLPWIHRLMISFDYLLAGGYTGFSASEITNIKQWLKDAGTVWSQANMDGIAAFGAYPGTHTNPQNFTCVGATCTNVQGALYLGGPNARQATANWFNAVSSIAPPLTMGIGLMTNTQSLIDYAVRWTTAFIKVGIWDDGATVDFRRWGDFSPNQPGGAWSRSSETTNDAVAVADMYARAGNTSLYDLTAPTEVLGGSGGTVGLQKALELLGKMANGTTVYLVGDGGQVLTWINSLGHDYYYDIGGGAVANLYYRNSHIKTAMERNFKAGSGDNTSDCFDPQMAGCFSGSFAFWADVPFMFGGMESNLANPYLAAFRRLGPAGRLRGRVVQ